MKKIFILSTLLLLICVPWHMEAQGQGRSVSGFVTDGSGDALVGVTVTIPGTSNVAITNGEGAFVIRIPAEDAVLRFSYVGYRTEDVAVGGRNDLAIVLATDASLLDEVVVIGYGVQQKKLVTGATVQVKGDDIAKLNTTSALGALQSQTPGVSITQASGMPGEGFKVFIRGMGTINSYGPLYVIDGVAGGDINNLNPADIESIDVLKDAASAAIYGSRAANGVILVTTKQGRKGGVQVSLDGYYGWQNVYRMPDPLNAQEYMMIQDEAALQDGQAPTDWSVYFPKVDKNGDGELEESHLSKLYDSYMNGSNKGTNWLDASRNKNAPTRNYTFNITGGTEMSTFSIGLGYTSQEGIIGKPKTPTWERYTARVNSEHTLIKGRRFDIVKFGENLTYTYRKTQGMIRNGTDMYWSDIYDLMRLDPLTPIYDEEKPDGTRDYWGASVINTKLSNPIGMTEYNRSENLAQAHILRTNAYLTVQPIKNLIFKTIFGYNFSMDTNRQYFPVYKLGASERQDDYVQQDMGGGYSWNWENTLTYQFSINNNHNFTALLGQSIEKWGMGQSVMAANGNLRFHDFEHAYINNTPIGSAFKENYASDMSGGPWGMGRLASFFGRVSYDYKNKYMLTVVLRSDGSSNFMRGHRWGYFPSVSAGWVVTEEPWMEGTRNWMDFLKIRASWGQNGNSSIPNFQYLATIASGGTYNFGSDKSVQTPGTFPDILPNPDVSWETSEQIDLGLDARFFGSRLGLAFDYYIKNTKDWLVRAPMLNSYGAGDPQNRNDYPGNPYINGGDIRNSGVEVALDWSDRVGEFSYGANVNFSYNKNEVTRIANEQGIIQGQTGSTLWEMGEGAEFYRVQVGRPVGFFYGYQTNGIFQNADQIYNYNKEHGTPVMVADPDWTGDPNDAPLVHDKDDFGRPRYNGPQNDAMPGDVIWLDRNGDNIIDEKDKGYLGNPYPDFQLGIGLNFAWKGFDLNITMNGAFGHQIIRSWRNWGVNTDNYTSEVLGRWHGEGTSDRLPRVTKSDPNNNYKRVSDLFMEDGDYMKIQNITLGYDFKHLLPSTNWLSQLRVYVAVQNLCTITGYSGMDPELGQAGAGEGFGWSSGIDVGYYPTPRTWMVGANLKF